MFPKALWSVTTQSLRNSNLALRFDSPGFSARFCWRRCFSMAQWKRFFGRSPPVAHFTFWMILRRRDPGLIRKQLSGNAITYTSTVPTLWEAILDADPLVTISPGFRLLSLVVKR